MNLTIPDHLFDRAEKALHAAGLSIKSVSKKIEIVPDSTEATEAEDFGSPSVSCHSMTNRVPHQPGIDSVINRIKGQE